MIIKLTGIVRFSGRSHPVGSEIDVPDNVAEDLITRGWAVSSEPERVVPEDQNDDLAQDKSIESDQKRKRGRPAK